MKRTIICLFAAGCMAVLGTGCVSTGRSVYVPSEEEGIASAGLDEMDYTKAAEGICGRMFRSRQDVFQTSEGKKPVIAMGEVRLEEDCPYDFNWRKLASAVRREVMRSGKAQFSTATDPARRGGEGGHLYKQLEFQNESGFVKKETAKKVGQFHGADFILHGEVFYLERRQGGLREVTYEFEMTLTDISSGLAVWSDAVKVRKNLR